MVYSGLHTCLCRELSSKSLVTLLTQVAPTTYVVLHKSNNDQRQGVELFNTDSSDSAVKQTIIPVNKVQTGDDNNDSTRKQVLVS